MAKKLNNSSNSSDIAMWCLITFLFLILICFVGYWCRTYFLQKKMNESYDNYYNPYENFDNMESYMENFDNEEDDKVTEMDVPTFAMFMAPWCGHCQTAKPEFEKIMSATKSNPQMKIVMLDCDKRPELASRFSVDGFPTIRLYKRGMVNKDNFIEHEGPRTVDSFQEFLNENSD